MARLAVAASWGLGKWDSMDEYTCMIPREQYDGPFYRAVMALHQNHFVQANEVWGNVLFDSLIKSVCIFVIKTFVKTFYFFEHFTVYRRSS